MINGEGMEKKIKILEIVTATVVTLCAAAFIALVVSIIIHI